MHLNPIIQQGLTSLRLNILCYFCVTTYPIGQYLIHVHLPPWTSDYGFFFFFFLKDYIYMLSF